MSELTERDTQTKVKHEILKEYLIKWGSIITNGLKGRYARNPQLRSQFRTRFVYVDYFAFSGAYTETGNKVYGSPVLGVQALDEIKQFFRTQTAGLIPTSTAVLFEEDAGVFDELLITLQGLGYADRIRLTDDFSSLRDGDIAVIHGDSSQYVDRVLEFIDVINPTYSFHFVDPYGTKAVERSNIEKIVSKNRADCIINMMLNTIYRFMVTATKDKLAPAELAHADYFDKFFGSDVWRKIAHRFEAGAIGRQEAESQLVDAFDAVLQSADEHLSVKQIPLKFQDKEQTLYCLFLTTHDPTGAFRMNEVLADARIREFDYRDEKRQMRSHPEQTPLFDLGPAPKRPVEPQTDIDHLADQIYARCRTRTLTFKEILNEMIQSPYHLKDITDALRKLREQNRASFYGAPSRLTNKSEVKFE